MRDEALEAYKERVRFETHPRRKEEEAARAHFHITYHPRGSQAVEVGRIVLADDRTISAGKLREKAMRAAAFKFNVEKFAVISAVRVHPKPSSEG